MSADDSNVTRDSAAVKSALRALLVVELLTEAPDGLTFPQITARLSLPKSSTYALLRTMSGRGHLTVDAEGRYRIGLRIWQAGQAHEQAIDLARTARPYMRAARDELAETVQLAVLDGIENVYLAKEDSDQRLVLQSRVGARLPAYATGLGKVLLAGLSNDEVLRRLAGVKMRRFTPATIASKKELIAVLEMVRDCGYATDRGEYTEGVMCVAVPVWDREGSVAAAMSVSVPLIRAGGDFEQRAAKVLQRAASAFSTDLGYSEMEPMRT